MSILKPLIESLKDAEFIFIQTHNFPDHDSVASAFGLMRLLENWGIEGRLIYEGDLQRDSLARMIRMLEIPISHSSSVEMNEGHKIIIVDGSKGQQNVTDLIGDEVAVIDQHQVKATEDVPSWISLGYGACSTIITPITRRRPWPIPRDVATASCSDQHGPGPSHQGAQRGLLMPTQPLSLADITLRILLRISYRPRISISTTTPQ
jgi:nanoRNase/pAp phosphatase (c-di-AMP/oligoRNAs hydrolase)